MLSGTAGDYAISRDEDVWTIADMVGDDGTDTISGFEFLRYGDGSTVALGMGILAV